MNILQVHKFFYPHAGAETVLLHTRQLLESRGHTVVDFGMRDARNVASAYADYFAPGRDFSDPTRPRRDRARDALASVYSLPARHAMGALLDQHPVDVAHVHVIFHHLTFSVVDELHRRDVPLVMTLHDYKIACPAYVLYRDGNRCRECVGGAVENVARHRCIKGSVAGSTLAALEARLALTRGSWDRFDAFIAPSQFAGQLAIDSGIPEHRVHVLQNFLPDDETHHPVGVAIAPARFLLACRLEEVKGVRVLIDLYVRSGGELGTLVIAGAGGALHDEVQRAADASPWIDYRGVLTRAEVRAELERCRAALVPSLWDENNPMSLLEARATGIPAIVTNVGGLPEMVHDGVDGLVVEPGDPGALASAIARLARDPMLATRFGRAGHATLLTRNSADAHYRQLVQIYDAARDARRARSRRTR